MNATSNAAEAATRAVSMLKSQIEAHAGRQASLLQRQAAYARDRIAHSGPLNGLSDRRQLAENLHAIISKACQSTDANIERVTKQSIVEKAGMQTGQGKSGRLYDYALDPTLSLAEREKRAKRLIRKPTGYLRLADAAASLASLDVHRIVVDLVHGTSLAEGMDDLPKEIEPEHLTMLANAIRGEARRIIRQNDLDWYFRTIEEQGLVLSYEGWRADDDADMWTFLTVPSVNLFTEAVVHLEGKWYRNETDENCGENGEPRQVSICRRVGLAIAPFGSDRTVRPFFVRRPALLIKHLPWRSQNAAPPSDYFDEILVDGLPNESGVRRTAKGRIVVERAHDIWQSPCFIRPWEYYPGDDHEFIEVTASSIAKTLDSEFARAGLLKEDALHFPAAAYTKSPPGTRTAALERALLIGQSDGGEESKLMTLLEDCTRKLVESLRTWVEHQSASNEDAMFRMASGNACRIGD